MKVTLCEVVLHYHEIETDDESLEIGEVIAQANANLKKYSNGIEALKATIKKFTTVDVTIRDNHCGTEIDCLEIIDIE